ncbi:hypothetical protein K438DRAFT_1090837 [Mycena galopus ATCC 62051]|nr:hypothetical protein K438DRAFT_1090837 [Mycena galopus ATCC 62051]
MAGTQGGRRPSAVWWGGRGRGRGRRSGRRKGGGRERKGDDGRGLGLVGFRRTPRFCTLPGENMQKYGYHRFFSPQFLYLDRHCPSPLQGSKLSGRILRAQNLRICAACRVFLRFWLSSRHWSRSYHSVLCSSQKTCLCSTPQHRRPLHPVCQRVHANHRFPAARQSLPRFVDNVISDLEIKYLRNPGETRKKYGAMFLRQICAIQCGEQFLPSNSWHRPWARVGAGAADLACSV